MIREIKPLFGDTSKEIDMPQGRKFTFEPQVEKSGWRKMNQSFLIITPPLIKACSSSQGVSKTAPVKLQLIIFTPGREINFFIQGISPISPQSCNSVQTISPGSSLRGGFLRIQTI